MGPLRGIHFSGGTIAGIEEVGVECQSVGSRDDLGADKPLRRADKQRRAGHEDDGEEKNVAPKTGSREIHATLLSRPRWQGTL